MVKTFTVRFKEISNKKKNPGFKLGAKEILKNKKIKKEFYKDMKVINYLVFERVGSLKNEN